MSLHATDFSHKHQLVQLVNTTESEKKIRKNQPKGGSTLNWYRQIKHFSTIYKTFMSCNELFY